MFESLVDVQDYLKSFLKRWKYWYDMEYRRSRKEWGGIGKTNNQAVRELLNMYFLRLSPLLFDDVGEWRYP